MVYFIIGEPYFEPHSLFKRSLCSLLIFALLLTNVLVAPVSYAADFNDPVEEASNPNDAETVYDLVVLVVDQSLSQSENYLGLKAQPELAQFSGFLDEDQLGERIIRYQQDILENNELTDVRILSFNKETETVQDLANALENMYRNGDSEASHKNRLVGVVLIGDVPLPVVNKSGNRFVSVFPYVDFSDKAYNYNPDTLSYERNEDIDLAKPEIWHGVIRADGGQKIAEFLDKNHLYYLGKSLPDNDADKAKLAQFWKFDRKLFFGDLVHEEEQINPDIYQYYIDYLAGMEDLAYMRYNKYWANELVGPTMADLPINEDNPINQGPGNFAETIKGADPLGDMPDIYSKNVIDQFLIPYYRVFGRYISHLNDWVDYTGRYQTSDVYSLPMLITMKDEFTKFYLREVNFALEKEVNELVEKMQEPLPLLEYAKLSGEFGNGEAFEIPLYKDDPNDPLDQAAPFVIVDDLYYRFHYKNEKDGKFYVKGIAADNLESAKQCGVYLGSTKSAYFDNETLNFDPKAEGGEFSILTRSMRSDNFMTNLAERSVGVNTRLLSTISVAGEVSELSQLTEGAYAGQIVNGDEQTTGEIVESNPSYGVSAFMHNPLNENYANPLEGKLKEGDVIVKVNGRWISPNYTLERAVDKTYKAVEDLAKAINDRKLERLKLFEFKVTSYLEELDNPLADPLKSWNTPASIIESNRLNGLSIGEGDSIGGLISLDFYREGELKHAKFTFTVSIEDEQNIDDGDNKLTFSSSKSTPTIQVADLIGGIPTPDMHLMVLPQGESAPANFASSNTNGAIFSLYENNDKGYSGGAYDASAGCNAVSTSRNSDRCFAMVAAMPVLDAAGSVAPKRMQIPKVGGGFDEVLKFPENVKKNNQGLNSGDPADYEKHVDQFQFPEGVPFEDVDEVLMNSCYAGLPSSSSGDASNSNPYKFVLDKGSKNSPVANLNVDKDFYGRLLQGFGDFVSGDLAEDIDYNDADGLQDTSGPAGYDPSAEIWQGLDNISADQIIINTSPLVTLKDFADHYGLYDGINNDNPNGSANGDSITDYEWVDLDNDGIYETKWYDFDEASPLYALDSNNVDEIARKLLAHQSSYTVPFGLADFPAQYNPKGFNQDITLNVDIKAYGKDVSSVILHNEPSNDTIAAQVKSMAAASLPIDNPRYIAFQAKPESPQKLGIAYKEPNFIPNAAAQAIINDLDTEAHYYPGEIQKIDYINVFDEKYYDSGSGIPNLAQVEADLGLLAKKLSEMPGSYRVQGIADADGEDVDLEGVFEFILNEKLSPIINNDKDDPFSGFDLIKTSNKKLYDSVRWKNMNIDEKHAYALEYYLNGDSKHNAYVGDASLYPKPADVLDPGYGYEASYLVLNGENDYFDMKFNKDLPEESDNSFTPFGEVIEAEAVDPNAEEENAGSDNEDDSVDLLAWLKELQKYIESLDDKPFLKDACTFAVELLDFDEDAAAAQALPLESLEINVNQEVFSVGNGDDLVVTVKGLNQDGELVGPSENDEMITINFEQDEENPVFTLIDGQNKLFNGGVANFKFRKTGEVGTITLGASSSSGFNSGSIQVLVSASKISLSSYVYTEVEGFNEYVDELQALELKSLSGEGGSAGNGGAEDGDGGAGGAGAELEGEVGSGTSDGQGSGTDTGGTGVSGVGGTGVGAGASDETGGLNGDGDGGNSGNSGGQNNNDSVDVDSAGDNSASGGAGASDSSFVEDLSEILSEGSEGNSGQNDGLGTGTGSSDADIKILSSDPVEDIELHSQPISEGAEEADQNGQSEASGETDKAESVLPDNKMNWQEYYILEKYYERFLDLGLQGNRDMWVAELFSDRLLAFNEIGSNTFEVADKVPEGQFGKYEVDLSDVFTADGKSLMKIEAQIFNGDGKIEMASKEVKFSILPLVGGDGLVSFEDADGEALVDGVAKSKDGIATIYLRAGKTAGKFEIKAEVLKDDGNVNQAYPPNKQLIYLDPGEPKQIKISADSSVLLANNQAKTMVHIKVLDEFGNLATNTFTQLALFVGNKAKLDESIDLNSYLLGIQIAIVEGSASFELLSKDQIGEVNLTALLLEDELSSDLIKAENDWEKIDFPKYIGASKSFSIIDKLEMSFEILGKNFEAIDSIMANGKDTLRIGVQLKHEGQIEKRYEGPVNFKILTPNIISFKEASSKTELNKQMSEGGILPVNVPLESSTLSGELEILVEIPGFVSDTIKLKSKPGAAKSIELLSEAKSINTNGKVSITARLLDQFGNLVDSSNDVVVHFEATEATKSLVSFLPVDAPTGKGIATTEVSASDISGIANIKATVAGLKTGTLSLDITKHLISNDVKKFAPRSMYISLLGGAFADVDDHKNLAETLLYSGQVQSVSAVTAVSKDKKHILNVDPFGKLEVFDGTVELQIVEASASFPYQKIVMTDSLQNKELGEYFLVPKGNTNVNLLEGEEEPEAEGVFVKQLLLDPTVEIKKDGDDMLVIVEKKVVMKVDQFGRISLSNDKMSLRLPGKDDEQYGDLTFIASLGTEDLAVIRYVQDFGKDVQVLPFDSTKENFEPGVYFKFSTSSSKYAAKASFSRSSSLEPKGAYLIDLENEIDPKQAAGGSYASLESAADEFGLGFEKQNKHMLLFAAGNSVGESHMPYASEAGIIYGDPTIRLDIDEDLVSEGTGYSKDLGKPIFTGTETIKELIDFDINGDAYDDLLLVYENGLIRLLENEISNKRFNDKGYILDISNGITSIAKIDVNNDGYDDLVVGNKEACKEGEQCVSLFTNDFGHFVRSPLNLALEDKKAYEMKAGDMNADGCTDLVVSDSSGDISIFYNKVVEEKCKGLSLNHGFNASYGYKIDSDVNLVEDLFIYYDGVEEPRQGEKEFLQDNGIDDDGNGLIDDASNLYKFIDFSLPTDEKPTVQGEDAAFSEVKYANQAEAFQNAVLDNDQIAEKTVPPLTFQKKFSFTHIAQDPRFGISSTKQAIDVNGGSVGVGDEVEYLISIKNDGGFAVDDLLISDNTPAAMTLLLDSLECADAGCSDELKWVNTGTSLRSKVISGISVAPGETRIIRYKMKVEQMAKVSFDLGKDFTNYPSDNGDPYMDILVKPSVNPDGKLLYLYSVGEKAYKKHEVLAGGPDPKSVVDSEFEKQGFPSPSDLLGIKIPSDPSKSPEFPPGVEDSIADSVADKSSDSDYDGCIDSWDDLLNNANSMADAVAGQIENLLGNLRCNGGGCLPIPYNKAFLAADGAVPGLPVFSVLNPPYFIGIFTPSTFPASVLRVYASPTLTMGLGTAVCVGAGPGSFSPCYAFAVPGGIPGVCNLVNGGIAAIGEGIAKAKSSIVDPALGQATIVSDGEGNNTGIGDPNDWISGNQTAGGSWGSADDPISAGASVNIKIPGVPSVFTNWFDAQTDEIYNKLLDFPTIFFIYPDFSQYGKDIVKAKDEFSLSKTEGEVGWQSFNDFATSLAAFPFIQIEGKEIPIRIPAISRNEIVKWQRQWVMWKKHMQDELDRFIDVTCDFEDVEDPRHNVCDIIQADVQNLISNIQEIADLLDKVYNLPRDILDWRTQESKYATQIICYIDAIINNSGSYIRRQSKRIESWMKAIEQTIKTIKDWKALLDLMLEYQVSCDQCKNDRFSKLGLLLQIFVAIPDLPVIPMPKWPDLVIDVSNIKTGLKVVWPDLVFKLEPIHLPNLPTINLPKLIPDVKIDFDIPKIELPNLPNFQLPNLPDLPAIPIPNLPDLPKPPKIPQISDLIIKIAASIKPILKILCLLKNGLIAVPESGLATEIETLTQPSIQAVIPIIKNLGIQLPPIEYSYVKEIRFTTKFSIAVDTNILYEAVKSQTDQWNKGVKDFAGLINYYTTMPYGQNISSLLQKAVDAAKKKAIEEVSEELSGEDLSYLEQYAGDVENIQANVGEVSKALNEYIASLESEYENYPEQYYLSVGEDFIDPSDPILNRSIEEIEYSIAHEDLPDVPGISQLADLRSELIAYVKSENDTNKILEKMDDLGEFGSILVDNDDSLSRIASLTQPSSDGEQTLELSFFGDELEQKVKDSALDEVNSSALIAGLVEIDPQDIANGEQSAVGPAIGIYIVGQNGVNENVLNYTQELKKTTHLLYNDVDHDSDQDMILSMGGDVYWKPNYKNNKEQPKGSVLFNLAGKNSVSNYVNQGGTSVEGLIVSSVNNEKAEISWNPVKGAIAYEVTLRNSLYDVLGDFTYRYAALPEPLDSEHSQVALDALDMALPEDQNYIVELSNPDLPGLSLEIPNGNYFVNVVALDQNAKKSLLSDSLVVSPQACDDNNPPFPAVSATSLDVPIFKNAMVDASASFDTDGEIKEYYLEVLPYSNGELRVTNLDPDGDGEIYADLQPLVDTADCHERKDGIISNDKTSPIFNLGPFEEEGDIGKHEFILHVVDQSCNSAAQKFTVNVFAPEITLDPAFASTSVASGGTTPSVASEPFSLMRNRYIYRVVEGALKLAPRLDKLKDGKTDAAGNYEIADFELEDMILVENADAKIVGEIHPDTGNIGALVEGYKTVVNKAQLPQSPTSIDIVDANGSVLGTVSVIADANIDASLYGELGFNADNTGPMDGVNIDDRDLSDELILKRIPANDPSNPGGAMLFNKTENRVLAIFESSGNILVLDENIVLEQKKNDHISDPLIIQVLYKDRVVAELYISALRFKEKVQIVGPNDLPFASPRNPSAATLYGSYNTETVSFAEFGIGSEDISNLVNTGVLNLDYSTESGLDPLELVQRGEFIEMTLKMLCIVPRPEAYEAFAAGSGYSDVQVDDEHFAYIKEATLLGLVQGYKGNPDPATGLVPFKSAEVISRAEAVKVIVEALELKGVIDLSNMPQSQAWDAPYLTVAQNLNPYLVADQVLYNDFIITGEEAFLPDRQMLFGELLSMVTRVFEIYNCHEIDKDEDTMSDYCEEFYGIDDPFADEDNDGLVNTDECGVGSNPGDEDTDKGGVSDGDEVALGTNPLNPLDDPLDEDNDGLTNAAEIYLYGTDPKDSDTDDGGVPDGQEVADLTDPLDPSDDGDNGEIKEGISGIYLVPAECNACPCISTFLHKADIVAGDVFYPEISVYYNDYYPGKPKDKVYVFSKGNEVEILEVIKN